MKKTRALLIVSGILSFALAAGLIFAFVFLSFEGIVNNFSNLGVLCNFPEVVGVIGLVCLLFGLMCIKLGVSQFRQSRTESYVYKRGRFKLVCAIFVYLSLCVVGAFLIFETYRLETKVVVPLESSTQIVPAKLRSKLLTFFRLMIS